MGIAIIETGYGNDLKKYPEKRPWESGEKKTGLIWLAKAFLAVFLSAAAYFLITAVFVSAVPVGDSNLPAPIADGSRIFVKSGESFQRALDMSKPGDSIVLEAGATFTGAFVLPNKSGNRFITVRTSAPDTQISKPGTRIDPRQHSRFMPKLRSDVRGSPVLTAEEGAHHFLFVGIEFLPTIEGIGNIIKIGTSEETRIEQIPHHIGFDRVFIHGSATHGQRRGIAANGRFIKIENSYISDIKRIGDESQTIAVWSSDGPVEIVNNYLEAAAIGILFGGAGAPLELIPSNCIVKNNHINKPVSWRNTEWVVKNMFEIKNGRNIKIQNNLMTNNWAMGQAGTAIVFATRADNSNTVIDNIEFSNNVIRGSGNAVNIYGSEGNGGRNLAIRNNIFDQIDGPRWGGSGHFMIATEWTGLVIENNTVIQNGNITNAYGKPIFNFVFQNNIIYQNEYGFIGDDTASGMGSINRYFPDSKITNNIIIGGKPEMYGGNNYYPSSLRQIGFSNLDDFRLNLESPYRTRGFGGRPIGAELDLASVGGG